MVTRRLSSDSSLSASSTMLERTPPASMSSAFSPPIFTPSSAMFSFEEQHMSTRSHSPGGQSRSRRVSPAPSSTTSGAPRFTPPSTSFTFGDERTPTPSVADVNDYDPDRPLSSVEGDVQDVQSRSNPQSTPGTELSTPSPSTSPDLSQQDLDQDEVLQHIGGISNLRLTSPQIRESSSLRRDSGTPSIQVTPSATPDESTQSRGNRTDSLVGGVEALQIEPTQADPFVTTRVRDGRSPSQSRRRRSGSNIPREVHQVEREDPPETLFYRPEVQEALANARVLTSRMMNVLSSSNLHRENGSSVEGLHQEATRLNRFQLPSSRIVGLVGDAGVGKSSLINSLLDKTGLARASGSGTACTCAVTEYHFHESNDFIIHVDYFPLEELKKQFEELLNAYREHRSPQSNSRDNIEGDENNSDRTKLQEKAKLAEETFKASFGERLRQDDPILSSVPFERAVETMVEWASQLLPQEIGQESFSTKEECSSRLSALVSESDKPLADGQSRARWPFIRKMRVYLRAYILSKGLIIADLPGLRDLNSARKAITESYVRQCHQIFVVAKIDRAISNESIKEIIELASRVNLSKIDVVCTRSEDIQTKEARHDWMAESATIDELLTQINTDQEAIESLQEEIKEYLDDDDASLTREEERELVKLQKDKLRAEKSKEENDFKLLRLIIKLRNDKVRDGLQESYRSHPVASTLKVFCISNNLYEENRDKPIATASPFLNLSGILELRRYCIGIVADGRLHATRDFINNAIPAFLGSVELWIQAGSGSASAEKKQQILDAVAAIEQELDELKSPISQLNNVSLALTEAYDSGVHLRMRQGGQQWTNDSRQASFEWQNWHHSTYKAFCSNFGSHSTPARGSHCWNEEAMESMTADMSDVWNSFVIDLEAQLERLDGAIIQSFDDVFDIALAAGTREPGAASNSRPAMQTFAANMRHRKDLTLYGIEQAVDSFHSNLTTLNSNAFSSVRTAFIGRLMERTYHAANIEYGTGSDRRRKNLITDGFSSRSLFENHCNNCKTSFRNIARGLQEKVKEILDHQIERVETDLQMLRDENVVLESERDPEYRRRVKLEVERAKQQVEMLGQVVVDAP